METTKILYYDGSFQEFLIALYQALREPEQDFEFRKETAKQQHLFGNASAASCNPSHAREMWESMQGRSIGLSRLVYFAFLSEQPGVESLILEYLRTVFHKAAPGEELRQKWQSSLTKWARAVEDEKTSLENSLVFTPSKNRIPRCEIAPRYNVLPLLSRHFRQRSPGMEWIIYDRKRTYGLRATGSEVRLFQGSRHPSSGTLPTLVGKPAPVTTEGYRPAV